MHTQIILTITQRIHFNKGSFTHFTGYSLNGLGSHAPSAFTYTLPKNTLRFATYAAIDDEAPKASMTFKVYLDSIEVWNSGQMRSGDPKKFCSIPVTNNETIRLVMDEGKSKKGDHANWLIPKIQSGS